MRKTSPITPVRLNERTLKDRTNQMRAEGAPDTLLALVAEYGSDSLLSNVFVKVTLLKLMVALDMAAEPLGLKRSDLSHLAASLTGNLELMNGVRKFKNRPKRRQALAKEIAALRASLAQAQTIKADYVTVEVAAKELCRTAYSIRRWIKLGQIEGHKIGDGSNPKAEWRIATAEIKRVKEGGPDRPGTHKNRALKKGR